jgi:hypothetical protein
LIDFSLESNVNTIARSPSMAGPDGLSEDEFGRQLQKALGFIAANRGRRQEWMVDPELKGVGQVEAERTLARVLAHRAWVDQLLHGADADEFELIAELLSLPNATTDLNLSPQRKRERLFEALLNEMEALSRRRPVLAMFEDAHWIDPTSREMLDPDGRPGAVHAGSINRYLPARVPAKLGRPAACDDAGPQSSG